MDGFSVNTNIDHLVRSFEQPLSQLGQISYEIMQKLVAKKATVAQLAELSVGETGDLINNKGLASHVHNVVRQFPRLDLDVSVQPITRSVLRVTIDVTVRNLNTNFF